MTVRIVVARGLPTGIAANAAAVLGMSLGARYPELLGPPLVDAAGSLHEPITAYPVPVLTAPAPDLSCLLVAARAKGIWVADFSAIAQSSRDYGSYAEELLRRGAGELEYLGIVLAGEAAAVSGLTGSLPLFR